MGSAGLWPLHWLRGAVRLGLCWAVSLPTPSSHSRLPVARSAHGATVYSDKLWIFAGYDGNAR